MSESLSKTLMIIVTVVLVIIATIALIGILNSSSDKSTEQTNKFNPHRLNVFVVSPPQGGHVKFYPVVDDNHQKIGYVSSFIMYTDKPLHNNTMYLKVLNVPPDKIYVEPLGNETYSDGKVTYHYKYNVTVFYDKDTFDRLYNDNKNDYVYVSIGSGTISSLNYGEIEIGNTSIIFSEMTKNSTELKYPQVIVLLTVNNLSEISVDKVIMINNSESKPITYVVYEPSVLNDSRKDLSNTKVIIGDNVFDSPTKVFYDGYQYTTNSPVVDMGNKTNVLICDRNGNKIFESKNVQVIEYPGYDNNNDSVIDFPTSLIVSSRNSLYIDAGYVLHYTLMNFDTKYILNVQNDSYIIYPTGEFDVVVPKVVGNVRGITLKIYDYSGYSKNDAEQNYESNNPSRTISISELRGRISLEDSKYVSIIRDDNGDIVGYDIEPQGYVKEMVDLSNFLRDNKYHILKVNITVSGYLWNTTKNEPSNITYNESTIEVLTVNNTGEVSLYDSKIITNTDNNVDYMEIFVSNPTVTTLTMWNKTTNTTDITSVLNLREGDNIRGTDKPKTFLINSVLNVPYPENESIDEGLYVNLKDDYVKIYKQNNITTETLKPDDWFTIKFMTHLIKYGIYNIQVTGKDTLTLLNKYFLWDGYGIWWLDFDKNIGHYYPDFPYKKQYNITDYHGKTLFGSIVLTYIVFTNDTFEDPHYIENIPIDESQVGVDLNNDGDTNDIVNMTVFDKTMYDSIMGGNENSAIYKGHVYQGPVYAKIGIPTYGSVPGSLQPVWQTKYVGIRFTYIEDGIGEAEIPFQIENVTQGQNKILVNGKEEDVWFAKVWVKIPVIRDSSTGDLNNGYLYWYGGEYLTGMYSNTYLTR